MASFTDLPETLASMSLVNNINSDILANKGQIKSLIQSNVNISSGLKSFHHNTSNLFENQIHHFLNTTTQHEHVNTTDTNITTNKNTKPEDNNNYIDSDLNENRTYSDESDGTDESSTSNEEEDTEIMNSVIIPDAVVKQVNHTITKMKNKNEIQIPDELNNNVIKRQATAMKGCEGIKRGTKILRIHPSKRRFITLSSNHQKPNKKLTCLSKAEKNRENLKLDSKPNSCVKQDELELVSTKKNNEVIPPIDNTSSHLIQRRNKEQETKDVSQVCDTTPLGDGLLCYNEMPPHLQFNPYITSGYRPILNAWGCVRSLCYVHNETVNIFTHGLPIIYILLTVPKTMPWHLQDTRSQFLIWSHLAGATCPWLGSILYHMFMNCGSSPLMYRRLLQLDMFGIWISQSFGALPMLFASVHCLSSNIRLLVIASYCVFSIWGLRKALIATTPWSRRICFALPFMMRNLLCLLRLTKYGGGAPDSLVPTILQDVMCVIGGVIGAEKVPEKWWPGTTDLCFNSHNIMHVLALLALYYNNSSSVRDIEWIRSTNSPCFDDSLLQ